MANPIHPYVVYTTEQAASLLNVSVVTIQRYIRNKKLKAKKIGKWYRLSGQSLIDFMNLSRDAASTSANRVRTVEETSFGLAFSFLTNDSSGKNYLELFELTAQALLATLQPNNNDGEEELIIKYIGTRVFNHAMVAYRSTLSGYYQASYAMQRDLIETAFLADYFRTYPEEIKEWKSVSNEERVKKFSPSSLYNALDKRDKFKDKKRKSQYQQYCEYASHVSYPGFSLLTNESNQIEIGPFYNEKKLINTLHDLCRNFGAVMMQLAANVKSKNVHAIKLAMKHMEEFDKVYSMNVSKTDKYQKTKASIDKLLQEMDKMQKLSV